jgi:hypothetical protein
MIETYKTKIVYDKPVYVGCTVLDLSKLHMMDFHYNVIQAQFGNRAKLIYSATDSFVYEIEHDNIYDWIKKNKKWLDLSKSEREDLKCKDNENRLGAFKDELHSLVMTEFLALNPKTYAFRWQKKDLNFGETKKAKGVPKATVDKDMQFESYAKVLEEGNLARRETTNIGSFNQQLFTFNTTKIVLNAFYDKMKMLDRINCQPFGFIENE